MYRIFVAVDLPETVKAQLSDLRLNLPGANWTNKEQFHLTLRFIGEVDGMQFREVQEALADIQQPTFQMELKGVGAFYSQRQARVLWAGVVKVPELERLRNKIEKTMVELGFEPEQRKFSPHITLARLKSSSFNKIGLFLEYFSLFQTRPFEVSCFHLYSGHRTSQGMYYRQEVTYSLT